MKKKRIAHIAGGLTTGGVEAVIYNYCSRFDPQEYELVYVSYDTPNAAVQKKFEELGFTVYSVTKKKDNFFKSWAEVRAIFKAHHINIVHSHMTLMSFVTSIIGWRCGVKVRVAHSHLALHPHGIKRVFYGLCKILTRLTATHYYACGAEAAAFLYGKRNMDRQRVTILNNAVDPDLFGYQPALRQRIREQYELGDRLCVGHIGRFTEQKNHMFLLDVFRDIYRQRQDSLLLLIGDGPLMDNVKQRVREYALEDAVLFTGACSNTHALYQAMDVFLLPSLYEGLPVVLVEAQCNGLRIFVSDKVTSEIAFSDNMEFLPLETGSEAWAQKVLESADTLERKNMIELLKKSGYDIDTEAKKLDAFYSNSLK